MLVGEFFISNENAVHITEMYFRHKILTHCLMNKIYKVIINLLSVQIHKSFYVDDTIVR
jgi:hypothetical protein